MRNIGSQIWVSKNAQACRYVSVLQLSCDDDNIYHKIQNKYVGGCKTVLFS